MAYNQALAARVRNVLIARDDFSEKKMFGGLTFLLGGNMCCGIVKDELMVRVGPDAHATALALPHARPMDFTGRAMKGMVYVGESGLVSDDDLSAWVALGVAFAGALPPKKKKTA